MIKKVLVVLGTRPEAIKLAPLIRQLLNYPEQIKVWLCNTGQHREMIDQALDLFNISPDFDLDLMRRNQPPSQVASQVLGAMEPILKELEKVVTALGEKAGHPQGRYTDHSREECEAKDAPNSRSLL